jgi:hypothetical protein
MSARNSRLLLVAGGIVAAVALFLVLRPGDDEEAATTAAAGTTAATDTTVDTTAATTETETETDGPATTGETAQPAAFAVAIRAGTVAGGLQRWTVAQGERVRIVVRSDVEDSVHLHGYDLERPVAPGAPAILAFEARLAGRFELEAHHGGGQIAQLDVQP